MERRLGAIVVRAAKDLEGSGFWRCRESEERQVRLSTSRCDCRRERFLWIDWLVGRIGVLSRFKLRVRRRRPEGSLEILRGLASLRRVSLVDDHREAALCQVFDLVEDEW